MLTLTLNSITLTLPSFTTYTPRQVIPEQSPTARYSASRNPVVNASAYRAKHLFSFGVALTDTEYLTLQSLLAEQQRLLDVGRSFADSLTQAQYVAATGFAGIVVEDYMDRFVEHANSPSRIVLTDTLAPATGKLAYFTKFLCLMEVAYDRDGSRRFAAITLSELSRLTP